MKKFLILALALVMALACAAPGFAVDEEDSFTLPYDGDEVNFIKADGSQFGMFTPQDGTTVALQDGEIAISDVGALIDYLLFGTW